MVWDRKGASVFRAQLVPAVSGREESGSAGRHQILYGHDKESGFNFHCELHFKNIIMTNIFIIYI